MARGIRLYDVVEDDLLYPITVTELVYDNVKEKTLKDILDHIFESPTITTPIISGGTANDLKIHNAEICHTTITNTAITGNGNIIKDVLINESVIGNCSIRGENTVFSGTINAEEATINGGTIKALITGSTIDNCNIENSNFHDGEIGDSVIKNVELDGTIQGGIIQGSRINNPEIYGGNSYNLDITSSNIHVPKIDGGEINRGTINDASIYASTSYNQILYTPKIYGGNFGGKNEEGEQEDLNLVNPTISGGTINADSISIKGESGFIKADGTIDDNAYVTIDTVQTISGLKKFSGTNYFMNGLRISEPNLNESYSFQRSSTNGNLTLNHFTGSNMKYLGEIDTAGNLTAYSFIKKNGKSTEFLKADGSVDSNTYLTSHQSLADYAKKSEIPTKTSQLTNDSGFLTSHQSLSNYYNKTQSDERYQPKGNYLTSHQSLTNYATKSEMPTKTSQLTNDSGYLTSHQSLASYLTKTDASNTYQPKGSYLTLNETDGVVEVGRYFDFHTSGNFGKNNNNGEDYTVRIDGGTNTTKRVFTFPTSGGGTLATESFVTGKGYLTSHQSLDNYYKKDEDITSSHKLLFSSASSMIQFKEGTYGDKFAIHGDFAGADDANKMYISSAVGANNTDPTLDKKITMLLKSGNVGIGTTTPTEKLEVNGNVKAGGFKVNGKTGFLKADGSVDSNEYVKGTNGTLINPTITDTGNNKFLYIDSKGDMIINDPTIYNGVIDSSTINDASLTGQIDLVDGCNMVGGEIQTNKISIKDGKSSQFLKADGSVDETNYFPIMKIKGMASGYIRIPLPNGVITLSGLVLNTTIHNYGGNVHVATIVYGTQSEIYYKLSDIYIKSYDFTLWPLTVYGYKTNNTKIEPLSYELISKDELPSDATKIDLSKTMIGAKV